MSADVVHVLVADDHEVNRRIVTLFLQSVDWKCTPARNGADAVELCQARRFDIILMDMVMPVLDGLAATCRIRAGGLNRDTPIIALTANATDADRQKWADIGVHDFLTKPMDGDQLIALVASRLPVVRKSAIA